MSHPFARITAATAATCAMVAGCLLTSTPAMAATDSGEAVARTTWNQYGVPVATQDHLLAELEAGRTWDSMNGKDPVMATSSVKNGVKETVETFADGSIAITSLELPTDPREKAAVGCRVTSSSHYSTDRSCNISTNVVVASAAYVVSFRAVQGGPSQILSRSSNTAFTTNGVLGNITSKRMVTNRTTQSGSNPAMVTGYFTWTSSQGAGSRDYWLQFNARGTSTWAQNN